MTVANKLPQCFLHNWWSWWASVFLSKPCDVFFTVRKQKRIVQRRRWVWQPARCQKFSSWTEQAKQGSFQNEPRISAGLVPSVLSLSENTAQLTSSRFHSSKRYQLCIKCGWRARVGCHAFQAAVVVCTVLPFLRQEELHLIFLIPVSPFFFFFFFFFWCIFNPIPSHCLS